jgi:hypothetical protein
LTSSRPIESSPLPSQIVCNPATYPNFLRFLELRKRTVEVIKAEMTFSVSRDGGAFEWAGTGLRSVFCQTQRVFDPGMWRMLFDIARFNSSAVRVLGEGGDPSIGEYLKREGYSRQFKDDYLIVCPLSSSPLCARSQSLVIAHDGRRMEHPTGCMRHGLPGQDPCSFPAQPSLVANHRKAFLAYYQRRQVRRSARIDASF